MTDLLDELDEAENCRCGKTHEECAEDGGCKWSRAILLSQGDRNELARLADLVLAGPDIRDREGTWRGRANQLAQRVKTALGEAQEHARKEGP